MNLMNLVNYCKNNDIDIFSGVSVPTPLDADTVKSAIMVRCGLLTPVYNDPDTFIAATTLWFTTKQWTIEHLIKIIQAEYSPIENVDRYDSTETNHSGSNSKSSGFTNTEGGTDSKSMSNSESEGGSNSTTDSNTNTNEVSAYNSTSYQADNKQSSSGNSSISFGHTTSGSGSESTNYGHTLSNNGNESGNDSYKDTFTQHLHGNIGVTTNQALINQELELLKHFDIYGFIASEFEKDNMIMLY